MIKLPKTYNAKGVEDEIYQRWESSGLFNPDNLEKADDRFWKADPYSIAMPPPNATGELHMGHAMMLAIEDLLIRYTRMVGYKTLWLPGTDHAAIATQNVVERQIWETEGKTRHNVGREELLRRIEEFVSETRGRIQTQIRKMGSSCDWSREKYTLSPELSLAVRTIFKRMYDAGLIYRGNRMVNWCLRCGTTLADDEVEYQTRPGQVYYISYPLSQGKDRLVVATVRPETMLADTAVAVNPNDPRYKKYIGQKVMLPLINRELPIIADSHIDPEYGTGVMKVTPGHDPHDFEIGQRHGLETINLLTLDGKINSQEASDHGFEDYAGLDITAARDKIVATLENQGFLDKTEDITHNVGFCYRCGTAVEPIISKQWFVSVNQKFEIKNKKFVKLLKLKGGATTLKEMMTVAVESGAIRIVPERFEKIYMEWMKNLRDWNISRQIWFGHRIPVYYCQDCGEIIVEVEQPPACPKCHSAKLLQDEDTLDTWFSSGLWTFSTLGWPSSGKSTEDAPASDLETYHPTTILETGYDILFFWVGRMILMTGFALEDIPFKTVYLHGLIRDQEGKKMSKSKGNVVNPLDMIERYGTDALRLSLIMGTTPGLDSRIYEEKIQTYRNFINKLWNISRYILSHKEEMKTREKMPLSLADEWILEQLGETVASVNDKLNNFEFGLAGEELMKFTKDQFADWYIEISKIKNQKSNSKETLPEVLTTLLKLWHPFAPFITEHIWSMMSDELLIIQTYPRLRKRKNAKPTVWQERFTAVQQLVTGLRNLRAEYRVAPKTIVPAGVELPDQLSWIEQYHTPTIEKLARVKLNFAPLDESQKMPYFLWLNLKVYLLVPQFDPKTELDLAKKELGKAENLAAKYNAQLAKKDFLEKAPAAVVEKLQSDFAAAQELVKKLHAKIQQLK